MSDWIILPARGFAEGKTRLAGALDATARSRLNAALFRRSLEAALRVAGQARVLVVSRDAAVLQAARLAGAQALAETAGGLNQALEQAAAVAAEAGARRILSLACDLPRLDDDDLRAMLDAGGARCIVIAPDAAGTGTNALLLAPPGAMPYRYGEGSLAAHLHGAMAAGTPPVLLRRPGLGFDLDTEADLAALRPDELTLLDLAAPPPPMSNRQ